MALSLTEAVLEILNKLVSNRSTFLLRPSSACGRGKVLFVRVVAKLACDVGRLCVYEASL